jgi:hypothetical protein
VQRRQHEIAGFAGRERDSHRFRIRIAPMAITSGG